MIIKVQTEVDIKVVSMGIRTEDIDYIYEDPYDKDQTVIVFYESLNKEKLNIYEEFDSFLKRYMDLEIEWHYDTSVDFGDEEFRNHLLDEERTQKE